MFGGVCTSGYPWSMSIRLNIFSYELSLIGTFLRWAPGTIVLVEDNLYLPQDNSWDGPFGGVLTWLDSPVHVGNPTCPGTCVLTWTIPG